MWVKGGGGLPEGQVRKLGEPSVPQRAAGSPLLLMKHICSQLHSTDSQANPQEFLHYKMISTYSQTKTGTFQFPPIKLL